MNNFIIELEHLVPVEQVEPHMDDHMNYLVLGAEKGYFLTWGPKVPRTGGIIIAQSSDRTALEAFAQTDPFVSSGVAKVSVTEFTARKALSAAK